MPGEILYVGYITGWGSLYAFWFIPENSYAIMKGVKVMINLDLINLNCPGARTADADLSLKIKMLKTEIITPDYYAHFPIPLTGHFTLQKLFRWVNNETLRKKLKSEAVEITLSVDGSSSAAYKSNVWDFVFDQGSFKEIGQIYTQPGKKVLLKNSTSSSNLSVQLVLNTKAKIELVKVHPTDDQ